MLSSHSERKKKDTQTIQKSNAVPWSINGCQICWSWQTWWDGTYIASLISKKCKMTIFYYCHSRTSESFVSLSPKFRLSNQKLWVHPRTSVFLCSTWLGEGRPSTSIAPFLHNHTLLNTTQSYMHRTLISSHFPCKNKPPFLPALFFFHYEPQTYSQFSPVL